MDEGFQLLRGPSACRAGAHSLGRRPNRLREQGLVQQVGEFQVFLVQKQSWKTAETPLNSRGKSTKTASTPVEVATKPPLKPPVEVQTKPTPQNHCVPAKRLYNLDNLDESVNGSSMLKQGWTNFKRMWNSVRTTTPPLFKQKHQGSPGSPDFSFSPTSRSPGPSQQRLYDIQLWGVPWLSALPACRDIAARATGPPELPRSAQWGQAIYPRPWP